MATTSYQHDPRSFITPDAFEVSEELLGTPLAKPNRRLAALLVDLVVTGLVTVLTRSFGLVLGVVAATLLIRAGFKRTPVRGSVFGRAMRLSVGCLGLFVGVLTAVLWASCGVGFDSDRGGDDAPSPIAIQGRSAAARMFASLAEAGVVRAYENVETLAEAERTTVELIAIADEMGIERDELRRFLVATVPEDAPWAAEADAMIDRLLPETRDEPPAASPALDEEIGAYSDVEALEAYLSLARSGADDDTTRARRAALGARLAPVVAADSLDLLLERIAELERTNRTQQRDLEQTTAALADAESGTLFGWLREFADELGFGFGWWALYLTVFLSWWNGQTVGKRLLGIRVVRLDGAPLTWWVAFERAGGYAAGFATGLLGFAQVYWDANRQAIHDRIVGTVVVDERTPKVSDWESAL